MLKKVLLIGAGDFGTHYLRILTKLDSEKKINLMGVVVNSRESASRLRLNTTCDVYTSLSDELLLNIDAVFVVTPPETHFDIVSKCLLFADVFVQKPISENSKEACQLVECAKKNQRILAVGHIFRFHSVTQKLLEITKGKGAPVKITGTFINPASSDKNRPVSLELLHMFDIVDFIWSPIPMAVSSTNSGSGRIFHVDVRYDLFCDFSLKLGWKGSKKERILRCEYAEEEFTADFISNEITIKKSGVLKTIVCSSDLQPLEEEILGFLDDSKIVNGETAAKIVQIAERAMSQTIRRPKVAVIGGGIFGINAALELHSSCDVSLFEKKKELMDEGTKVNQFRHHAGYHYPRSDETVVDVQASQKAFEAVYSSAICENIPTYYGIAKNDSHTSPENFLLFCMKHSLPYNEVSNNIFAKDSVSLSVSVREPSYHFEVMKDINTKRLSKAAGVKVHLGTEITEVQLLSDGKKKLTHRKDSQFGNGTFDVVINATYANINFFTEQMKFPVIPIRIDLAEVLIVKLPIEPISLTVIDGPFATLMPTGNPNEFTLYHVTESILDRYTPANGLVKRGIQIKSNAAKILEKSKIFFPELENAELVESRFIHRGVQANREHDDSRVAEIFDHGFSCYSILSGKIVSSIFLAQKIKEVIDEHYLNSIDEDDESLGV